MTATVSAEPTLAVDLASTSPGLLLTASSDRGSSVVHVTGELDLATRNQLVATATADRHPTMLIDLGGVTFMDCSGYSSLVACRHILERQGRSLSITGQTGQPARLFDLIAQLEECPLRQARSGSPASLATSALAPRRSACAVS